MDKFTLFINDKMPLLRQNTQLIYGQDMGMYMSLRDMKIIRKNGFFSPYYYVDENNLGKDAAEFKAKWKTYHSTPHTYKNEKFANFSDAVISELYNFLKTRSIEQRPYVTQNIQKKDKYKTVKYKKGGKKRSHRKTYKKSN